MLLSLVLTIYVLSNVVMPESGLVAVTVFGVVLANMGVAGLGDLTRIKEALVILIVSALFIVLASDLDAEVLARLSLPLLAVTAAVVFLVRPAAIMLATIGSGMTLQERILVSWIGPRGIVAAAVAGLASIKLSAEAYPSSELLQPAVFAVITATVLLHGFTLRPLARRLNLISQVRPSIAIIGASPWSIDLARALHDVDVPATLVDIHAEPLKDARSAGIKVLRVDALAEKGGETLERHPHDYILAATPDEIYNALLCAHMAPEVGRERVLQIAAGDGRLLDKRRGLSRDIRGKIWADADLDYSGFEERHEAGWRFRSVAVEEDVEPDDLPRSPSVVPAVIVRADGSLSLVSPEGTSGASVVRGDSVIAFLAPDHRQDDVDRSST